MGPAGGSRQEISPRFLRHFHIIAINPFSDATMTHIFSTILTMHLSVSKSFGKKKQVKAKIFSSSFWIPMTSFYVAFPSTERRISPRRVQHGRTNR
jgi:hypothetical protein